MAVLLTKRPVAKRVYATVINAGNNTDGYKEQGKEVQRSAGSTPSKESDIMADRRNGFVYRFCVTCSRRGDVSFW